MKLLLFLHVTVASGILLEGGDSCSDSSSDENEGHNHPRPPRPSPTPPAPEAPRCPSGWLQFDRPQGRWCVQVVHANTNYYAAQVQCAAMGGTLSGVQTDAERVAIANEGRRIQQQSGIGDGSIWLGARRKASCPRAGVCSPKDTFAWMDGFTTGTDGILFSPGQPDGLLSGRTAQDCMQQFIFPWADTSATWPGIPHGYYDDQWCSWTTGPVNRFFACGKRAV